MAVVDKSKLWKMSVEEYKNVKLGLLSLAERREGCSFLDAGCDDGTFTIEFGEAVGAKKLYGIDKNEPAIKKARKRGVLVKKSDLNKKFPFPSKYFDVILCNQVIEHMINPDNLFKEVHRTLKNNGYAVISTPNLASLHNRIFLFFGWQPTNIAPSTKIVLGNPSRGIDSRMRGPSRHLTALTYKCFEEMLQHYNFKIDKKGGSGFYPFTGKLSQALAKTFPKLSVFSIIKVRK